MRRHVPLFIAIFVFSVLVIASFAVDVIFNQPEYEGVLRITDD